MRRPLALPVLALLLLLSPPPAAAQEKTPLQIEDLYRSDDPAMPVLSPDGKRLAYARQWVDAASKRERSSLWLVDGPDAKPRALEKGEPDARRPIFSPDGKWIAFLSTRPRPDGWKQTPRVPAASDPVTDVWLIPTAGGPALPLAGPDKPYGRVFNDGFYGRVAFAPDGGRLVFVADEGKSARGSREVESGVSLVRPDQGEGYTGYGTAHV